MLNEIAVAAIGFGRVVAAVENRFLDQERKVVHHRFGIVVSEAADGARWTGQEGVQGAAAVLGRGRLGVYVRRLHGLAKDRRGKLPASIAVDAGRIDKEVTGRV